MAEGVDLHVFTDINPTEEHWPDGVFVHHVERLVMKDGNVELLDQFNTDARKTLQSFLSDIMTTEDGDNTNLGLYDFIDTLKIVLLNVMLQKVTSTLHIRTLARSTR